MDDDARRTQYEEVARELIEPLRRFLARRTDPATADDALAETLLVCWRRFHEMPDDPLPWAYAVARNCLANALRSERRQVRLAARVASTDPPSQVEPAPDPGDPGLADAFAALSERDAELLRLWAWEQLTPAEIAEALEITPNAVSIRLHRAKQKLRDELRKIEAGAGHEESREGRTS